jgi:hypothetical protein
MWKELETRVMRSHPSTATPPRSQYLATTACRLQLSKTWDFVEVLWPQSLHLPRDPRWSG